MTTVTLKDITIHPVVEQQGPFFDGAEFFPTLTRKCWRRTAPGSSRPSSIRNRQGRALRAELRHQDAAPQHPDRYLRRQPQAAAGAADLEHDEQRPLREGARRHRARRVNDIDYVMCTHLHVDHVGWNTRLENGRWVPTFPKAKIHHGRPRARLLDPEGEGGSAAFSPGSPTRCCRSLRPSASRSSKAIMPQRNGAAHPHPRPYHRSLRGAGRQSGPGCADHRRHDPFAAAGPLSRARHARRLQLQAGRRDPAQGVRPLLRGPPRSCA